MTRQHKLDRTLLPFLVPSDWQVRRIVGLIYGVPYLPLDEVRSSAFTRFL